MIQAKYTFEDAATVSVQLPSPSTWDNGNIEFPMPSAWDSETVTLKVHWTSKRCL